MATREALTIAQGSPVTVDEGTEVAVVIADALAAPAASNKLVARMAAL